MSQAQTQSIAQPEPPGHSELPTIRAIYDARSSQYDANDVHVRQARDYVTSWAGLKPGDNVLDLACGTGLVALGAKRVVGDKGCVVGVDVSEGMLNVARRKAVDEGGDRAGGVRFLNADISGLNASGGIGKEIVSGTADGEPGGFDVITCASALILLPDPVRAVENWKSLLKPNTGRIVTDVQTKDANVVMNIFAAIAPQLGLSVPWDAVRWRSMTTLEQVMLDAGLNVENIFETESYVTTRYDVGTAVELFEKAVNKEMFERFSKEAVKERAKELFVEKFKEMAGEKDEIVEACRYWVVVASMP